ncbi:centriole, cilia and spindle-associated protein [Electrophorus electricus]|uniref:centriole, cilia and spindle-associated protein n=1 Tax=Electrophorus electricus TaxID=8005 RepID=UPI0015D05312|nr:centriole, cilia and spindle-associated protein [Electrophorus electricus]
MTSNTGAAKKIRTEYMKKFRDPKWETFSKCYEDSLKYRLSRRLMEQTHRPLFGDGWESGTNSSSTSSPRLRIAVESSGSKPHTSSSESKCETVDVHDSWETQVNGEVHTDASAVENSRPTENDHQHMINNGSLELVGRRGPKNRPTRSETNQRQHEPDTDDSSGSALRTQSHTRSQPPGGAKEGGPRRESRRPLVRHEWTERNMGLRERKRTSMRTSVSAAEIHQPEVSAQTRRDSEKNRGRTSDRRRARSADLEKLRRAEVAVVDDCWMTEYMRCFSSRLR